jgi:hypothetical protein
MSDSSTSSEPGYRGPSYLIGASCILLLLLILRYIPWLFVAGIVATVVWLSAKYFVFPAASQLSNVWQPARRSLRGWVARSSRAYHALDDVSPGWSVLGYLALIGMGVSIPLFFVLDAVPAWLAPKLFSSSATLLGIVQFVPRVSVVTRWALGSATRRYPFALVAAAIALIANSKARDLVAVATGEDPAAFVTFVGLATIVITPLVYVSVMAVALCLWSALELVVICVASAAGFFTSELAQFLGASPWRASVWAKRLRRRSRLRSHRACTSPGMRIPGLMRPTSMVLCAIMVTTGWSHASSWLEHESRVWSDRVLVVMDFHPADVCTSGREPLAARTASDRFVVAHVVKGNVSFRTVQCASH